MRVEGVHQLEGWRMWSWSQAREPRAGQSVEDQLEVEVRPEQSTEGRGLVEAESLAHHQHKLPGPEGNLVPELEGNLVQGDNCSVVWEALQYKPVLKGQ